LIGRKIVCLTTPKLVEEFTMKLTTLTHVAAAALLASGALAHAQTAGQQQQPGSSTTQPGVQTPRGGGAGSTMQPGAGSAPKSDTNRSQNDRKMEGSSAQEKSQNRQQERASERERTNSDRQAGDKQSGKDRQQQAKEKPSGAADKGAGGGVGTRPDLSSEQRTTIRQRLSSGPRVNNVNFTVSIGSRIPRSVSLSLLPPTVIEIVPQYRGYRYVLVGDQILIVDPETFEIVYVIDA
jgi:hypothetical protein